MYKTLTHKSKTSVNSRTINIKQKTYRFSSGFTLIEFVITILVLGILAVVAISKMIDLSSSARAAAINGLAGAVRSAMTNSQAVVAINGPGVVSGGTSFANFGNGFTVRIWNGWPDRWWDGIGIMLTGASPSSGGYLSTAAFPYGDYTFYGYGGLLGDAGWVYTNSPSPVNCSVRYQYDGGAPPIVIVTTGGC